MVGYTISILCGKKGVSTIIEGYGKLRILRKGNKLRIGKNVIRLEGQSKHLEGIEKNKLLATLKLNQTEIEAKYRHYGNAKTYYKTADGSKKEIMPKVETKISSEELRQGVIIYLKRQSFFEKLFRGKRGISLVIKGEETEDL